MSLACETMVVQRAIDQPVPGQPCYRQSVPVEGWVWLHATSARVRAVAAYVADAQIGRTELLFPRADVVQALQLPADAAVGFRFWGVLEEPFRVGAATLRLVAELDDGQRAELGSVAVEVLAADFTDAPYGDLRNPRKLAVLGREHLYSTGHPATTASPECVRRLTEYLPKGARVLDVGCGVGAYCDPLRSAGFEWIGCETSGRCIAALDRRGLPHRPIRRSTLPWQRYRLPAKDAEFDAAIAIEVLEHIREPAPFLTEMARVVRGRALFSVPNLETLALLSDRMVAPWHLLEPDHHNFFSRFNLAPLLRQHFRHVEVFTYGNQPLASPDGLPLPYHLFAVCEK